MADPTKKVTEKEVEEKLKQFLKDNNIDLNNIESEFKKTVEKKLNDEKKGSK